MQELFERAQKLRDNGKIEDAISLYHLVTGDKTDPVLAAKATHMIGVAYYQNEQYDLAEKALQHAQEAFEEQGLDEYIGFVLRDRGLVARNGKRFDDAESLLKESIQKLHATGSKGHEAMSLVKLGTVLSEDGNFDEAIQTIQQGIEILKETSEKFFLSTAYFDLAKVFKSKGMHSEAKDEVNESLEILNSFSDDQQFQSRRKDIEQFLLEIATHASQ